MYTYSKTSSLRKLTPADLHTEGICKAYIKVVYCRGL